VDNQTRGPDVAGSGTEMLGDRLRRRRKELKLTLQEVADAAGFSVGFISQIERGISVPSLVSMVAVCRVLRVEIGSFFRPLQADIEVAGAQRPMFGLADMSGNAVTYERLSASFAGNVLRSTLIHEPPGFRSEPMSHEGEEIFFIVEGALTLELDGERIILEAGDTAHFPSVRTHATWNHTDRPATIFHTCTMDVFGEGEPSGDRMAGLAITRAGLRPREPGQ
jgi:quercetin dioxygenase-like cupin family protein/DNA-binding XRE family transcriptional regulator